MGKGKVLIHNYSICGIALVENRTFDECVGIAINAFMKHQDVTSKELSEFIKTSGSNMSKLINGKTSLTMNNMLKICSALKISPATLVDLAFDIYTYPNNPNSKWVKK